jgi:hypothetical protein
MTTNKEMFDIESVKATPDSVGDWNGDEEAAAKQFNRFVYAIVESMPDEAEHDDIHQTIKHAWDVWGSDDRLLSASDEIIEFYVYGVREKFVLFNVNPDNEAYSSNAAGEAINRLKAEENIKLEWAGKTRDSGYGEEHLYSVTGPQETLESIQVMFWDRCIEEVEEEANRDE